MWDPRALVSANPRVVGSRPRGLMMIVVAVALAAGGVYCMRRSGPFGASTIWIWLTVVAFVAAVIAIFAGSTELKRPVLVGVRAGRRGAPDTVLHWHPEFDEVFHDFRFEIHPSGLAEQELVAQAGAGRMTGRLVLDGAPFVIGSRAKLSFALKTERGRILDFAVRFRLRCQRESPHGWLRLQSGIECLADFEPSDREFDMDRGVFRLEFELPPGLPGSDLRAEQPVYWDLTVDISDPGPFHVRKFIPVTDRTPVSS
jgi:hypothetical protein